MSRCSSNRVNFAMAKLTGSLSAFRSPSVKGICESFISLVRLMDGSWPYALHRETQEAVIYFLL